MICIRINCHPKFSFRLVSLFMYKTNSKGPKMEPFETPKIQDVLLNKHYL